VKNVRRPPALALTAEPSSPRRLNWAPPPLRMAPADLADARYFTRDGGLKILTGHSAAPSSGLSRQPEHRIVEANALVFDDRKTGLAAFKPAN